VDVARLNSKCELRDKNKVKNVFKVVLLFAIQEN